MEIIPRQMAFLPGDFLLLLCKLPIFGANVDKQNKIR